MRHFRGLNWRSWLAGFTTRACCLLAAGITAVICGLLLGETDLVRAGGFAVAIPVIANVVVRRSQVNIASRRAVEPARISAGNPVTVSLTVTNRSVLPTGALMMEDTLPRQLHGRARFVLAGLGRRESRAVTYRIPPMQRGRYRVGPLRLRLTDPFRMVDLNRSFTATSSFVVTPFVDALPGLPLPRSWDTGENIGSHSVGAHGADDASTREYRRGDGLRKIHWRSTAKAGTLMVRHEERPWQGHALVLLDNRASAHDGVPSPSETDSTDPRDSDSLEWAISAVASIASHLLANQREATLIVGRALARHTSSDTASVLDTLAGLEADPDPDLAPVLDTLRTAGNDATIIAVLGRLDPASLQSLSRARPRSVATPAFAIVLDTATWTGTQPSDPSLAASLATLRAAGWTVVIARRGDRIAEVWAGLLSQRSDRLIDAAAAALSISSIGLAAPSPQTEATR